MTSYYFAIGFCATRCLSSSCSMIKSYQMVVSRHITVFRGLKKDIGTLNGEDRLQNRWTSGV